MMYTLIQKPIKTLVRTLWKALFRPWVNKLPESPFQRKLIHIGQKIERRDWWWDKATYHRIYGEIMQHLQNDLAYDVIFIAPWLKRGGGDLGLLHHIRAQSEQGYRILLITTVNIDSPWLYKLPKKVQHLNLGKWHDDLYYDYLRIAILKKLLCQSTATSIHNVNSEWGWRVFRYEGGALKTIGKQLFISAFTGIPHKNGMLLGYADGYLPFCYQNISRVFCDTQWYPDELIKRWHLPPHLFQALYFPCVLPQSTTCESQQNSPILWASRFCTQKRPELLYAIAQKLPEREFHVYGTCESNCESQLAQLQTLPNVHYFGAYDDFASLVSKQKYVAFLYTSAYDGLPNVLLEAIASGLPVLASDVGGIHEFIHHKMLLPNGDDISAYITQIQNALNDDKLLQQSWEYSYELLRERHSWQHFVTSLTKNQGYFPQNSNQS